MERLYALRCLWAVVIASSAGIGCGLLLGDELAFRASDAGAFDGAGDVGKADAARLGPHSLYFSGLQGSGDRVRVPLLTDSLVSRPVNVGEGDFTIEFWFMSDLPDAGTCNASADGWFTGQLLLNQDIFGESNHGDYGFSLTSNGGVASGLAIGGSGFTLCPNGPNDGLATNKWHHVAFVRRRSPIDAQQSESSLYFDGSRVLQDDQLAYRNASYNPVRDAGPTTSQNQFDSVIAIGTNKFDAPGELVFRGWIDELRYSKIARYVDPQVELPRGPFPDDDPDTVALYHFDEGGGQLILDSSRAAGGPSHGYIEHQGSNRPQWSNSTPWQN